VDLGELRDRLLRELENVLALEHIELVDVRVHPQGRQSVVCLLIEPFEVAADGTRRHLAASVEDCARVSRSVEGKLDEWITWSYVLEVSSPGIDRPLRTPEHFQRFVGERVAVRMADKYGPRRQFTGKLVGFSEGVVEIELEGGETARLPLAAMLHARVQANPWKTEAKKR